MYEVRKVSENYEHPKDKDGNYIPLYEGLFSEINEEDWSDDDGSLMVKENDFDNIKDNDRTHYCLYEDISEGTPISPIFETKDELINWCTENLKNGFAIKTHCINFVYYTVLFKLFPEYSSDEINDMITKNKLQQETQDALQELFASINNNYKEEYVERHYWDTIVNDGFCSTFEIYLFQKYDNEDKYYFMYKSCIGDTTIYVDLPIVLNDRIKKILKDKDKK
jgi:hypothetical protein